MEPYRRQEQIENLPQEHWIQRVVNLMIMNYEIFIEVYSTADEEKKNWK